MPTSAPKTTPTSTPAEIQRAVYAKRQRQFADRSRSGWDQALETEVADLILRRLRAENINTGLDARISGALAAEGRKGILLTGNDPAMKIRVGDRDISGDRIVWSNGEPGSSLDPYIYLATADESCRERGLYETPRRTLQELAGDLGIPTDQTNMGRLATVLYKLHDACMVIHDDDDRWRAAPSADALGSATQPQGDAPVLPGPQTPELGGLMPPADPLAHYNDDATPYSVARLAELHQISAKALEGRLRHRRRELDAAGTLVRHNSPRRNEARFLYKHNGVLSIIRDVARASYRRNTKRGSGTLISRNERGTANNHPAQTPAK